jgi:hypothetical protein
MKRVTHKVYIYRIYLEYHSVCPLVRIWDQTLPQVSVSPPPQNQRGGVDTRLRGRGWGESQFARLERKPNTLSTLWGYRYCILGIKISFSRSLALRYVAAGALQTWVGSTLDSCKYQPAYRRPSTKFKLYANLILRLTYQAPL